MNWGDAQLVVRDCWKVAVYTPAVYSANMAVTDESRLYHHMKEDDPRIVLVLLDVPLGAVQAA